jgi:isoleucyl-tRNA synthetase
MRNQAHHALTLLQAKGSLRTQTKRFSSSVRFNSAKQAVDNKSFSKTLHLPKTSFPLWTDPSKSEVPFQERTGEGLYRWQVLVYHHDTFRSFDNNSSGKTPKARCLYSMMAHRMPMAIFIWVRYIVHDFLRFLVLIQQLGHALNKILKDIINRFHVSLGRKVQYVSLRAHNTSPLTRLFE